MTHKELIAELERIKDNLDGGEDDEKNVCMEVSALRELIRDVRVYGIEG